ncbi:RNB domain-containing ribonuclease [Occultella glacieicola]|uniref:RNB domain-containing ribonuclease n=1 Tax=Occultella glacieicola TaxID=2518684 RepID=A0ABY2E0U6_9MICO|nr:RNB domain-containing ribonuclease [Occultella glacieicola]TDE88847.1 RNB domain-containing ribonuclease [Occultella glacieicola]
MPRRTVHLDSAATQTVGPALAEIRRELDVPGPFSEAAVAEAEAAAAAPPTGGTDATDVEFVTIDPPGAKDLDQALHLSREGDGFLVRYAIADPASFVTPGGPIDTELADRGVTFYGPDGAITLHPPVLSEGAASLLADVERPACLWEIGLDATGEITSAKVYRARVRSREQLTYDEVQERIDAGTASESLALLATVGPLRQERERARGGVSLEIPEQEVDVDDGGYRLAYRATLPVEEWNAQISLLTGIAAAALMRGKRAGIFRTLEPADPRDVTRLRRAAHGLGIDWPEDAGYGDVLATLDATVPAHAAFAHEATSLFRGAGYLDFDGDLPPSSEHAAIAAEYAHVTAPLRRLVDRYGLEVCLAASAGTDVPDWVREALPRLPKIMNRSGQRANSYERACVDLVEAVLLQPRVGEIFDGVIVDLLERRNNGAAADAPEASTAVGQEGTVVLADPAVRATVTGTDLPLGESVRVRLTEADPGSRTVRFEHGAD